MRRHVLSEGTIIEESQRVTTMHPLFDAVERVPLHSRSYLTIAGTLL